jgi:hypothetical protein
MLSEFLKKRGAPPPQPAQPAGDPEQAADLKTDPWGMLGEALTDEAPDKGQETPTKPMKHTIEPELSGGPYHMVGAKDAYCDACDRPESQCICSPKDCDMTRPRLSNKQAKDGWQFFRASFLVSAHASDKNKESWQGTLSTGFVTVRENQPPRECGNYEYMKEGACYQQKVMADPDIPEREKRKRSDGSIKVAPDECCNYFENG